MPDTSPPTLVYAPRPKGLWLLKRRKLIVVLAVSLAFLLTGLRYRSDVYRYLAWHYWHWQLRKYAMPAPVRVASTTTYVTYSLVASNTVSPEPLVRLATLDPMIRTMVSPSDLGIGPPKLEVNYAGQRRRPDGQWRTVVISGLAPEMIQPFYKARVAVIVPPAWHERPPDPKLSFAGWGYARSGALWPANVYATEDPSDACAVVIELEPQRRDGHSSTFIVGRLTNDDEIVWTLRSTSGESGGPRIPTKPWGWNQQKMLERESSVFRKQSPYLPR